MKLPFVLRDRAAQGNFDELVKRLGFERVKIGTVTLTFTASADSAIATVTHGLATTPRLVVVGGIVEVGSRAVQAFRETPGATTFRVFGRSDVAFTGTSVHDWIAAA